ncbi:MAG: DUF6273 domain-containing protein [Lachnospiraceae bacterium]|nr:DUF6273 domain-containing protein [Lachnospiraceae bacterium]
MKMRRKWKRTVSLLLALCLVAGLLPTTTAFAAGTDTGKAIQLVTASNPTGGISGYDSTNGYDYIYYGYWTAPDDYTTSGAIKWRVLDDETNFDSDGDGTNDAGLFLLSDALYGSGASGDVYIDSTYPYSNAWQGSEAQTWCNTFASSAFSATELAAIIAATKSDNAFISSTYSTSFSASSNILNDDKVFFLSAEEAENSAYGFINDAARIANYGAGIGVWRLRSPQTKYTQRAGAVNYTGSVDFTHVNTSWAARPAFNLDLNSVLFTSAAQGGKSAIGMDSGLTVVSDYEGSEWKMTLDDSSTRSSFTASATTAVRTNTKVVSVTISYLGAQTGDNEYISALITDSSGAVTYYGRLKNLADSSDAGGTVEIDLSGITMGSGDTLYIFNEQYNGDYKTDYASALKEITIPTTVNDYDITNSLTNVSTNNTDTYCLASNSTDYTTTLAAADGYILPESITVTVGGTTLGSGGYTYNSATGVLAITATSITGDIIIAVEGVASTYTLTAAAPTFDAVAYGYTQPVAAGITITSTGNTDATITDVSLSGTDGGSFTLNKTDGTTITKGTTDSTTYTIQPAANLDAGTYIATITVTYNNSAAATAEVSFTVNKADQSVSYSESTMTKHINDAAITNTLTQTIGDGTISYTSSDTTVATVNATTGEVTIVGAGSTTITATAASTGNYNEATASYTLTVTAHSYSEPSFTWSEDGKSCIVSFTCTDCNDVQTVTATVISKVKTAATATENGVTIYTATVTFDSVDYTATKELADISATGSTGSDDSDETESTDTESSADSETTTTEDVAVATISAETGDNSQVVLWLLLLLISGVGIAGIAIYNTKRRRSR